MSKQSKVNISMIKINSIGAMCNVGINQNVLLNRHNQSTKMQGFGESNGDGGMFTAPYSTVDDRDIVDSFSSVLRTKSINRNML